jgi:hypothetical protein
VLVLCSDGLSGQVRTEDIGRVVDEELDLSVACDRLIAMANDQGGPDNITVVAARFEGRGLGVARSTDEVGYREFHESPPVEEPAAPPEVSDAVTKPWPITTTVDEERRRRGRMYSRVILVVGVLIALFALWRLLA